MDGRRNSTGLQVFLEQFNEPTIYFAKFSRIPRRRAHSQHVSVNLPKQPKICIRSHRRPPEFECVFRIRVLLLDYVRGGVTLTRAQLMLPRKGECRYQKAITERFCSADVPTCHIATLLGSGVRIVVGDHAISESVLHACYAGDDGLAVHGRSGVGAPSTPMICGGTIPPHLYSPTVSFEAYAAHRHDF